MMSVSYLTDCILTSGDNRAFDPPSPVTTMEPSFLMEDDSLDTDAGNGKYNPDSKQTDTSSSRVEMDPDEAGALATGKENVYLTESDSFLGVGTNSKESVGGGSSGSGTAGGTTGEVSGLTGQVDLGSIMCVDDSGMLFIQKAESEGVPVSGTSSIGTVNSSQDAETDGYESMDSEVETLHGPLADRNLMWSGIIVNDRLKSSLFPQTQLAMAVMGTQREAVEKTASDVLDFKSVTSKDLFLQPCGDLPPEQLLADDDKTANTSCLRWNVSIQAESKVNIPAASPGSNSFPPKPKNPSSKSKKSPKAAKNGSALRKDFPIVYTCTLCCRSFKLQAELDQHLPECREQWPHVCAKCGRGFQQRHRLVAHERTHTGSKPYFCKICRKNYELKSTYLAHMSLHEQKQGNCCDVCGKEFTYTSQLAKHRKIHTKEKVYRCRKCFQEFSKFDTLKRHVKMHTNSELYGNIKSGKRLKKIVEKNKEDDLPDEVPYKCLECQHVFKDKEDVREHIKLHEKNDPQNCEICGATFNQLWNQTQHMLNEHPGSLPYFAPDPVSLDNQEMENYVVKSQTPTPSPVDSEYSDLDQIHAQNLKALSSEQDSREMRNIDTKPFQKSEQKHAAKLLSEYRGKNAASLSFEVGENNEVSPHRRQKLQILSSQGNLDTVEFFENPSVADIKNISLEQYIELTDGADIADTSIKLEAADLEEDGAPKGSPSEPEERARRQQVLTEDGRVMYLEEEEPEEESSDEENAMSVGYDSDSEKVDSLGNGTEVSEDDYENEHDPFSHKKPYKCPDCSARYKNPSSLERHLKKHIKQANAPAKEMQPYECGVCGLEFKRAWKLGNHMVSEHADEITNADIVYSVPTRGRNVDIRKVHNRKAKEGQGKGFISTTRRTHPDPRDKLSCILCRKTFEQEKQLTYHSAVCHQERPHRCLECGRGFKDLRDCKRHMRTHTGETPYQCSVCKRSFTQSGNLMRHMKTHAGETPFKCGICDMSFSQPSLLVSHSTSHSEEERRRYNALLVRSASEEQFVCDCGKEFKSQGALSRHMKKKH